MRSQSNSLITYKRSIPKCGKQTSKPTVRHFLPRLRHVTSATAALPLLPIGRRARDGLCVLPTVPVVLPTVPVVVPTVPVVLRTVRVVLPKHPPPKIGVLCHYLPYSCDFGTIGVRFVTFATCGIRDCGCNASTFAIPYRWAFDDLAFTYRMASFASVFSFLCSPLTCFLTSRT